MKAAVYHGINDLRVETLADPEPGPGEAVLKVSSAGICGTDLRIFDYGHFRIPPGTKRILGHEIVGEIIEVGEGVNLTIGSKVTVAPNIGCGSCTQCISGWTNLCPNYEAFGVTLDGGFAEYMLITAPAIQQGNVAFLPSDLHDNSAILTEPLSCCINGQEAVAVKPGDVVLVIGAGPIGLMHVVLAKVNGAQQIIVSELNEWRLHQAETFGADVLVNPETNDLKDIIFEITAGNGVDVVIVANASPAAQRKALGLTRPRGRINFFGGLHKDGSEVLIDTNLIHYRQLILTGTTGSNVRQFHSASRLIGTREIELGNLVSDCFPLEMILQGFEYSQSGKALRVVIEHNS
jgi:L-iditol 2-dehydrogenase